MSGHSKWATIKHKKAHLDAKRGKIFTKIVKEITVVAREGGGDPSSNPRLRTLIEKAKAVNMPHDNLQRAIKKGTGELPGQAYEAQSYEGYGPGGIAVIIDVLTDNKNRAVSELRHVFSRHGGRLGDTGAVRWLFELVGIIRVVVPAALSEDDLMLLLLEYPVKDCVHEGGLYTISVDPKSLDRVKQALVDGGCEIKSADIEWTPKTRMVVAGADEDKAVAFLEAIDELDDVQNVYTTM